MTRRSKDKAEAVAKYEEFHRFEPKQIGSFAKGFRIPAVLYRAGYAKWVTYRSDKIDPSTLEKPQRARDYIHEFNAGVECYLTRKSRYAGTAVPVPGEHRHVKALTKLGANLGWCFECGDGEIEAIGKSPLPELYAVPSGKCLLVVQDKRDVIAMFWGGGLTVEARGIDG